MNVQTTSLFAYRDVQKKLPKKQHQVREMLALHADLTDKELARALNWDINTVTPRRGELVKAGIVEWSQTRPCAVTGKTCHAWRVVTK
ncbi:conserved protein of unknown function [Bradyrhizobium sp. ORS 285]|nr:conserved hypothetical protein [Bradyrhizobium sp. ORS 285]SMX61496.1 conserved protein of unknown function [Bradyrhizobium sp. ORS 285]